MKKIGFLAALSLCVAGGMKAQEVQPVVPEENKPVEIKDVKDINELKKSEQYVYGEVIEMLTDENENVSLAQQKSIAKMQTHVIEIFGERLKMDKKDVQEIWDVIDDKCQNVVIKKGDLLRVLTYIAKDAIFGTKSKKAGEIEEWFPEKEVPSPATKTTVINIPAEPEVADTVATVPATPLVAELPKDSVKEISAPVSVEPVKPVSQATSEAVPEIVPKAVPEVAVNQVVPEKPKQEEVKPKQEEVKPEPVVAVEVPALCQTLISRKTYGRLMSFLKEGKSRHELMFGNADTMQYLEKCYVVVVDKSTRAVTAVLDKGEGDRMNFMTMKTDRYTNYRGGNYAVIFVQEY